RSCRAWRSRRAPAGPASARRIRRARRERSCPWRRRSPESRPEQASPRPRAGSAPLRARETPYATRVAKVSCRRPPIGGLFLQKCRRLTRHPGTVKARGKAEDVRRLVMQVVVAAKAPGHGQGVRGPFQELGERQVIERQPRPPGRLRAEVTRLWIGLV